jgi:hypothetical protein
MKLPDKPDVVEVFQSSYSFFTAVVGFEDNLSGQAIGQTALPRDAELRRQRRVKESYGLYLHSVGKGTVNN